MYLNAPTHSFVMITRSLQTLFLRDHTGSAVDVPAAPHTAADGLGTTHVALTSSLPPLAFTPVAPTKVTPDHGSTLTAILPSKETKLTSIENRQPSINVGKTTVLPTPTKSVAFPGQATDVSSTIHRQVPGTLPGNGHVSDGTSLSSPAQATSSLEFHHSQNAASSQSASPIIASPSETNRNGITSSRRLQTFLPTTSVKHASASDISSGRRGPSSNTQKSHSQVSSKIVTSFRPTGTSSRHHSSVVTSTLVSSTSSVKHASASDISSGRRGPSSNTQKSHSQGSSKTVTSFRPTGTSLRHHSSVVTSTLVSSTSSKQRSIDGTSRGKTRNTSSSPDQPKHASSTIKGSVFPTTSTHSTHVEQSSSSLGEQGKSGNPLLPTVPIRTVLSSSVHGSHPTASSNSHQSSTVTVSTTSHGEPGKSTKPLLPTVPILSSLVHGSHPTASSKSHQTSPVTTSHGEPGKSTKPLLPTVPIRTILSSLVHGNHPTASSQSHQTPTVTTSHGEPGKSTKPLLPTGPIRTILSSLVHGDHPTASSKPHQTPTTTVATTGHRTSQGSEKGKPTSESSKSTTLKPAQTTKASTSPSKSSSKKNQSTTITPLPCIPTQLGQLHLNDHSLLPGLPACTPTATSQSHGKTTSTTKQTTKQVHGETASTTQHTTIQVHGQTTLTKGSKATTVSKITTHSSSSKSKEPGFRSPDVSPVFSTTNSFKVPAPLVTIATPSLTSSKDASSASPIVPITGSLKSSSSALSTSLLFPTSSSTKISIGPGLEHHSKVTTSTHPSHTSVTTSSSPDVTLWPKVFEFGTETVHPRSTAGLSIALAILVYLLGAILVVFLLRLRAHRARNGGNGHNYGVISSSLQR